MYESEARQALGLHSVEGGEHDEVTWQSESPEQASRREITPASGTPAPALFQNPLAPDATAEKTSAEQERRGGGERQ